MKAYNKSSSNRKELTSLLKSLFWTVSSVTFRIYLGVNVFWNESKMSKFGR
jgi:hypothetical protein